MAVISTDPTLGEFLTMLSSHVQLNTYSDEQQTSQALLIYTQGNQDFSNLQGGQKLV